MPKGRMLNKKISFDEKVAHLSLGSALLYTWCIPNLDVEGRIYADASILKGTIVPFIKELTVEKIEKCVNEISESGLIVLYGNSVKYMQFNGFLKNQKINKDKESRSEIPSPDKIENYSEPTPEELSTNSALSKVKESKGKGKESKANATPELEYQIPYQDIINVYHQILPELPKVKVFTDERKSFLKQRWLEEKERQTLDFWTEYFSSVKESDFLMGRMEKRKDGQIFMANFEWLIRPQNFVKVVEGYYINRRGENAFQRAKRLGPEKILKNFFGVDENLKKAEVVSNE